MDGEREVYIGTEVIVRPEFYLGKERDLAKLVFVFFDGQRHGTFDHYYVNEDEKGEGYVIRPYDDVRAIIEDDSLRFTQSEEKTNDPHDFMFSSEVGGLAFVMMKKLFNEGIPFSVSYNRIVKKEKDFPFIWSDFGTSYGYGRARMGYANVHRDFSHFDVSGNDKGLILDEKGFWYEKSGVEEGEISDGVLEGVGVFHISTIGLGRLTSDEIEFHRGFFSDALKSFNMGGHTPEEALDAYQALYRKATRKRRRSRKITRISPKHINP